MTENIISLGYFDTPEKAALAYNDEAKKHLEIKQS